MKTDSEQLGPIKLGKRVAQTIHQLGYPTESALKGCHRAYELGSDRPWLFANKMLISIQK